jgi:hypothetical protein
MASVLGDNPFMERRTSERRRLAYSPMARVPVEGLRVSWGGIWGGVLVAMGLLVLLSALGIAVGFSAVDTGNAADTGKLVTGAGLWAGVSLLVALFIGGMVSTRIGAVYDRTTGFFEGALVWVMSLLLMGALAGSGLGLLDTFSFELPDAPAAAWMGFGALLISLLAAVLGAMAGRRQPTSIGT